MAPRPDSFSKRAQSRPIGGYAPLIAHLARSLDPARVDLRLQTVAQRVTRDARGVRITYRANDREADLHARRAVACVPHGVLAPSLQLRARRRRGPGRL